ncbi:MAG: hypothetical protein KIH65_001630 [Candidatus Uhrbacteria bacterium]|nr:hypothetical protein [Candidatus Uhrbacteria bacterium]
MTNLITTPSNGSAILAYGSSSRPHSLRTRIAIGIVALILIIVGMIAYIRLGARIELPEHRILTIVVVPRSIQNTLSGELIASLPLTWRTAIESRSRTPVLLGWAYHPEDGSIRAFASLFRTNSAVASGDIQVRTKGLTHLLTQGELRTERVRINDFSKTFQLAKKHRASWIVDASSLKTALGLEGDLQKPDLVYGTWDGSRGSIDLPSSQASVPEQRQSDMLVILRGNGDEANPLLQSLQTQGINLREIASTPQALFISPSGTRAIWTEISLQDTGKVYAGFDQASLRSFAIPDQTEALELFADAKTAASGTPFIIETPKPDDSAQTTPMAQTNCPGTPRLVISGNAMKNTLNLFHAPETWKKLFNSLRIHETDGGGVICVNE